MALRLGDEAPNFTAETTQGTVNFHEWLESVTEEVLIDEE